MRVNTLLSGSGDAKTLQTLSRASLRLLHVHPIILMKEACVQSNSTTKAQKEMYVIGLFLIASV